MALQTVGRDRQPEIASHFNTFEQQHEAASLGMWVFLATEVMLFGGLFTAYTIYRTLYPLGFVEGSRHMDVTLGTVNTVVLLVSSATMAIAVDCARQGRRRGLIGLLAVTGLLGVVFMAIKGVEYHQHFADGLVPGLAWRYAGPRPSEVQLFMLAYFTMTGLHAIHLLIAISLVLVLLIRARRETRLPIRHTPFEIMGLYWHFIDIIWVFLLPLLYLLGLQA